MKMPLNSSQPCSRRLRDNLLDPDIWAPGLLILLGVVFFADPLFSSKNFYFRDILNFHYPLRRVLIDSYARGEFPLWNPFVSLGQPMLANPNYMAFYPTNLLHLFLPFNYAFKLHFILHPILAGLGLYFLQRRLGLSPFGSLAGALAYEFSGTVLSFLNLYNIIPCVALLPWIGWAFTGALQEFQARRVLGFGVLLALQAIAFEPMMFSCVMLLLAALTLLYVLESPNRRDALGRALRTAFGGGIFAAGLAAVQIIPTLELLPRSDRGSGLGFTMATMWSAHPLDLLSSLVPNLYGYYFTINRATSWGELMHSGREPYLVSFFAGTSVVMLAALSFTGSRARLQRVTACLGLTGIFLASGGFNPVYRWLFEHVPLFRLGRYPSKYLLLTALCVSIMASLGFEALLSSGQPESKARKWMMAIGGCGLLAATALLCCPSIWPGYRNQLLVWVSGSIGAADLPTKDIPEILRQLAKSVQSMGSYLLLGSMLFLLAARWRKTTLVGGLVSLLIAAELISANLRLTPLISDADVDYVSDVNGYLGRSVSPQPFRVAAPTFRRPLPDLHIRLPNRAAAWLSLFYRRCGEPYYGIMSGIQYSLYNSVDHLATVESEDLRRAASGMPEADALGLLAKLNSPILSAMGEVHDPRARLLTSFATGSNQELNLYLISNSASRALFVPNVEVASSHSEALQIFLRPDFRFENTVLLEGSSPQMRSGLPPSGLASIESYGSRCVTCRVEAPIDGFLVLLDSYYPGWHAYLDGTRVEVMRANYAFRAVGVPAGKHTVQFRYQPASFYWGLALSLITILSGILCLSVGSVRRR